MNYKIVVLCFSCFVIFSCSKQKLNSVEYMQYIENESNGLKVIKTIEEISYTVQFKPVEYVLLKENKSVDSKKEDIDGMQYYTLSFSLKKSDKDILRYDLRDQNEYYERVNYFSFGLQRDVYLVEGKDTLECNLFNYVRSYGLSPRADFILGFDKADEKTIHDKLIVFEDKVFGGGIIKLKISEADIKDIPELI